MFDVSLQVQIYLNLTESVQFCRIADVAVTKRHQRLDKIWIIFTRTSSRKSAKLFSRKLCHAIRPPRLMQCSLHSIRFRACYRCARFIQHTLVINACVTWQSFLANNFADFQYSAGKKISRFHPVIGGVSLQQHLLLWRFWPVFDIFPVT